MNPFPQEAYPMQTLVFFGDDGWLEDPQFRHRAWQEAIRNEETSEGYIPWVIAQHQALGTLLAPATLGLVEANEPPSELLQQAFPRSQWLAEVDALDTRLGYEIWIWHQLDSGQRCFLVKDIVWETDGEEVDDLPSQTLVVCGDEDEIADVLSEEHGWLVGSFSETEIKD